MEKFRFFVALLIACCVISACAPTMTVSQRQPQTVPCIGNVATIHNGSFRVSIENVDRSMRETKFGLGSLSKPQLDAMGENAYVRPQHSFLVISMRAENITKSPLGWGGMYSPIGAYGHHYNLLSKEGLNFEASNALGTFGRQQTGNVNVNPGTALEGTIIFDVPTGNYEFTITNERYGAAPFRGMTVTKTEVFRCSIGTI